MTSPTSGAVPRISATVKWYDRAKGLGFLVRDNGSFDTCFWEPVLTAIGLATFLPGAPVACETASAAPGPAVFGHAGRLRPGQLATRGAAARPRRST